MREKEEKRNESGRMKQDANVISSVKSRDRRRSWRGWADGWKKGWAHGLVFLKSNIHVERSSTKPNQTLLGVGSKSAWPTKPFQFVSGL